MSTHWFTADTHFNHTKIAPYCGRTRFFSEEELRLYKAGVPLKSRGMSQDDEWWLPSKETIKRMDDYLIDRINECVSEKDVLWHLGDFCMPSAARIAELYRNRIKCRQVNLIWGNHDDYSIGKVFNNVYTRYRLRHEGYRIILDHYCLAVWQGSHRGAWMLYGHSHSTAEAKMDAFQPGRRAIDVGVDNANKVLGDYRPFSFDELKEMMDKRNGCSIDHHEEKPGLDHKWQKTT